MLKFQYQGFRSSPRLNAGALDAEFETFQARLPLGGGFQEQNPFQHRTSANFAPSFTPQQQLPGWASDFQRLDLDEARSFPIPTSQFRHEAPIHRSTTGGWHQEFLQQQNLVSVQEPTLLQRYGNMGRNYQQYHMQSTNASNGLYTPQSALSSVSKQKQPENILGSEFDEAAFEKAFDVARMEVIESETRRKSEVATSKDGVMSDQHTKTSRAELPFQLTENISANPEEILQELKATNQYIGKEQKRLQELYNLHVLPFEQGKVEFAEHENITDEASMEERKDLENDMEGDELARTAGQLLDNLKDEQSEKFQQSSFLALMRQLRDKEVRIEGDQIVDVSNSSSPPVIKHNHAGSADFITCKVMQCRVPNG